jgi:hypothetical protein
MRPVRGGEGVVAVDVPEGGEELRHLRVVLGLHRGEAGVLDQDHAALGQRLQRRAVGALDEGHGLPQRVLQRRHHVAERHLRHRLALGPPEMRQEDRLAALGEDILHRRHDPLDPRGVGHAAALHRHVDVDAGQDDPPPSSMSSRVFQAIAVSILQVGAFITKPRARHPAGPPPAGVFLER